MQMGLALLVHLCGSSGRMDPESSFLLLWRLFALVLPWFAVELLVGFRLLMSMIHLFLLRMFMTAKDFRFGDALRVVLLSLEELVMENSRLFAQRGHSARCAPHGRAGLTVCSCLLVPVAAVNAPGCGCGGSSAAARAPLQIFELQCQLCSRVQGGWGGGGGASHVAPRR